jgi:5'-nucleotidase
MKGLKGWLAGGLTGLVLIVGGFQPRVFGANLAIVTTADLQSQVFPFKMKKIVNGEKVEVSVGGLGRVSAAANSVWGEMDGTLMVSSGDALMGTFYFMFKGIPEIEAMNRAGYQVIVPGNHEFDQGVKVYADALQHAKFDVVCANLITTNQLLAEKIKPFVFKEIGGVRVGIFGLITPDLARSSNVGNTVTALADIIPIARQQVASLRAGGAKLVIALTHIGTTLDEELARNVAGIDIIVGGHTHDYLFEKIFAPDGRETVIVHAGAGGSKVGVLTFEYAWGVACPAWETVLLDEGVGSDAVVTEFLAPYKKKFDKKLSEPIGISNVDLDGRKETVRAKESNLGDLIADSWLDWFAAKGNQTSGALVNGGGIRGDRIYPAGQLTMKDILEILPFGNTVYQVKHGGAAQTGFRNQCLFSRCERGRVRRKQPGPWRGISAN